MEPHLDSQEEKGSGHWSVVNLPRWIRLSFPRPHNHQTWETFLPSDRDQLRSLLSFLFRKHTTPATRRVGAPRTSFGLYKCLQYTIQCVHWSIHWDETDWAFSFAHPVFPTYFSLGRGLGCGVYLDAGSTRDPRTSLESFQMISKYRDATKFSIYQEYSILISKYRNATKPRVLLLDVTNFQYTRNIPYCFNNVLEEHSKLCGLMHCVNFLHFQSSVPLRKFSEIIGTRNCAFVDKPEDW